MADQSGRSLTLGAAEQTLIEAHRVHGEPVTPAAVLLVAAARAMLPDVTAFAATGAEFLAPVAAGVASLPVEARAQDGAVQLTILPGSAAPGAWMRIAPGAMPGPDEVRPAPRDMEACQPASHYAALAARGNAWGPPLQLLRTAACSAGTAGRQAIATVSHGPVAAMLDACLAAGLLFSGRETGAHVIRSIARLHCALDWPGDATVHLTERSAPPGGAIGFDVRAVASSGAVLLDAEDVVFARKPAPADDLHPIHATGNFALDPLQKAVDHVGEDLGIALTLAPFDQLFQTLAGTAPIPAGSVALTVAIAPERWLRRDPLVPGMALDAALAAGGHRRSLPDGREIVELHGFETDYLHSEIYDRRDYLPPWIRLPEDATIVDVGANIGMFSLFMRDQAPDARIIAIEPSPLTAKLLKANLAGRGNMRAIECGVDASSGVRRFVHYEGASVFSGFETDPNADRRALTAAVDNELRSEGGEAVTALAEEFLADRMIPVAADVQTISLSDLIAGEVLDRIDLLKIDAEKSEAAILQGLRETDWPRIRQIIVETHDNDGAASAWIRDELARRGFSLRDGTDPLLAGSGLSLLYATREDAPCPAAAEPQDHDLTARIDAVEAALHAFRARSSLPVHLVVGAGVEQGNRSSHVAAILARACERLQSIAHAVPDVRFAGPAELARLYGRIDGRPDGAASEAAIAYEPAWYAAAAVDLVRHCAARHRRPHKVIAVDADNTLWDGVCAEVGPGGVAFGPAHLALQAKLREMKAAGHLLVLVSKNIADDVWAVFDARPEMILQREDFADHEIGWDRKSDGLRRIAGRLDLGLDSFILVDDNEIECAQVRSILPMVLAMPFPQLTRQAKDFLDHGWAFDCPARAATVPDRTAAVRTEAQRREIRGQAPSFAAFIASLGLTVTCRPARPDDLARLSELTRRTNQFNIRPRGETESELGARLARGDRLVTVSACDRFGDYGIVGFAAVATAGAYRVEQFLLSCRALGRGVEQQMMAHLVDDASRSGQGALLIEWQDTGRNRPAADFISRLMGTPAPVAPLELPLHDALRGRLQDFSFWVAPADPGAEETLSARTRPGVSRLDRCYRDPIWLSSRVARFGSGAAAAREIWPDEAGALAFANGSAEERAVALAWQAALGRVIPDPDADFFALGGTSLQLVQVVGRLQREGYRLLRLAEAYAAPTVRKMAAALDCEPLDATPFSSPGEAAERALGRSEMQIWFEHLRQPSSPLYVTTLALLIDDGPDEARLRQAWQRIGADQPALRTTYHLAGRHSVARIASRPIARWTVFAQPEWDADDAGFYVRERASEPQDISRQTAEIDLVRLAGRRSLLVLRVHHIVADLASLGILLDAFDRALTDGRMPSTAGMSYGRWLASQHPASPAAADPAAEERSQPAWWEGYEQAANPSTDVVTARFRDRRLGQAIGAFASAASVTPLAVMLAALADFAGEPQRVAVPVSHRLGSGLSATMGNFVELANVDLPIATGCFEDAARAGHQAIRRVLEGDAGGGPKPSTSFAWHERAGEHPVLALLEDGAMSRRFAFGGGEARILGLAPQAGLAALGFDAFFDDDALVVCLKCGAGRLSRDAAEKLLDDFRRHLGVLLMHADRAIGNVA